jgi:CBS domain-containing protein
MTPAPETISPDATLEEARARMDRGDFRHLPVVEDREVLGIISDRDLRTALADLDELDPDAESDTTTEVTVDAIMCANPVVVTLNTPVAEAARLLIDLQIGALPVVEKGEIVGIFSEVDGLQALIAALMFLRKVVATEKLEVEGLVGSLGAAAASIAGYGDELDEDLDEHEDMDEDGDEDFDDGEDDDDELEDDDDDLDEDELEDEDEDEDEDEIEDLDDSDDDDDDDELDDDYDDELDEDIDARLHDDFDDEFDDVNDDEYGDELDDDDDVDDDGEDDDDDSEGADRSRRRE